MEKGTKDDVSIRDMGSRRPKPPPYSPRPFATLRQESQTKKKSHTIFNLVKNSSKENSSLSSSSSPPSVAPTPNSSSNNTPQQSNHPIPFDLLNKGDLDKKKLEEKLESAEEEAKKRHISPSKERGGDSPHSTVRSPRRHGFFSIEKTGYLKKKGQMRYVVIKKGENSDGEAISGSMEWFKKSSDKTPRGAIERLDDWELSVIGPLSSSNIFKLRTINNTNRFFKTQVLREYVFLCKDHKEMTEWVEIISKIKRIPFLFNLTDLNDQFNSKLITNTLKKFTDSKDFIDIKITDFPENYIFRLFSYLSDGDLVNLSMVTKNMNAAVRKFKLHRNLLHKQENIRLKVKGDDMNSYLKWDQVISRGHDWVRSNITRVSKMVCELGVPDDVRGTLWMIFTNADHLKNQDPKLFERESQVPVAPEVETQIQLDIPRTFPDHPDFITNSGTTGLGNILRAFSNSNNSVEYAQGCNFLAGLLITVVDEEKAFLILMQLMNNYDFQGMYLKDFPGLKKRSYIFERLFEKQDPQLYHHLKAQEVETTMYGPQWFLTLFSTVLPLPLVKRIWDLFFLTGWKSIMQAGLAIFKMDRDLLLTLPFEKIMMFLRNLDFDYANQLHKCDALLKMIPTIQVRERDMNNFKRDWELSNNVFL